MRRGEPITHRFTPGLRRARHALSWAPSAKFRVCHALSASLGLFECRMWVCLKMRETGCAQTPHKPRSGRQARAPAKASPQTVRDLNADAIKLKKMNTEGQRSSSYRGKMQIIMPEPSRYNAIARWTRAGLSQAAAQRGSLDVHAVSSRTSSGACPDAR